MAYNPNKVARLKDIITIAGYVQTLVNTEKERINSIEECLRNIQSIASTEISAN